MNFLILALGLNFIGYNFPLEKIINLFDNEELVYYDDINCFPNEIKAEMEFIIEDGLEYKIEFAKPDENFNRSDAIEDENWPRRRMIFMASTKSKKDWLLYYEIGGRAHNTRLVYSQLKKNNKIKKLYCLAPDMNSPFTKSKEFLLDQIKSNNFSILYDNGKPWEIPYVPF